MFILDRFKIKIQFNLVFLFLTLQPILSFAHFWLYQYIPRLALFNESLRNANISPVEKIYMVGFDTGFEKNDYFYGYELKCGGTIISGETVFEETKYKWSSVLGFLPASFFIGYDVPGIRSSGIKISVSTSFDLLMNIIYNEINWEGMGTMMRDWSPAVRLGLTPQLKTMFDIGVIKIYFQIGYFIPITTLWQKTKSDDKLYNIQSQFNGRELEGPLFGLTIGF
jgi:hypothetical protein